MRILHVIPRWIGGGPERHLLELARHDGARAVKVERRVLVLDRPLSAPLLVRARRVGLAIVAQPWREAIEREVAAADVVDITYWNHPELLELLRHPLPAARIVIRSAVAGHTLPQVLFSELIAFPDAWVVSAPPGHGAAVAHPAVVHLPALADMTRLDGYAPRAHTGVRATYLGGLTAAKLHPEFARIVAAVRPGVTFDLFGDGDADTLAKLREQLDQRGVAERVNLRGHVEDLRDAFGEADLFAYPLTPNSSATSEKALQEAMWVGVPPVLLTGTAAVGWLEPGVTGLVAPDVAAFAAEIDRLASDSALRRRVGAAARAFARDRFDPGKNAARWWGVIERAMLAPKRVRAPLAGAEWAPEEKFLQALGHLAPRFQQQLDDAGDSDPLLLRSEGGLLHYRNAYPQAEGLRAWSDALLAAEARRAT